MQVRVAVLVVAALAGCTGADGPDVTIRTVVAATPLEPPASFLEIYGTGFAAVADPDPGARIIELRVIGAAGVSPAEIAGTTTEIASPTRLLSLLMLRARLPSGRYSVQLFEGERALAGLGDAFEVPAEAEPAPDAAASDAHPADVESLDAGVTTAGDGDTADAADAHADADSGAGDAWVDAGAAGAEAGAPDVGSASDSGPEPFRAAFRYRQPISIENRSGRETARDATLRLSVAHAALVQQGRSRSDGADLAAYWGGQRLDHQWDDLLALGTDQLEMIVQLPHAVGAGTSSAPLFLYYGDPGASLRTTDAVFLFAERFDHSLPAGAGQDEAWYPSAWTLDCESRTPGGVSACVGDSDDNPTRRTLGTPRVRGMMSTVAPNETYEVSVHIAGRMLQQAADLLYFAYAEANDAAAGSVLLPDRAYVEQPPNASVTFLESDGGARTLRGWRLPSSTRLFTRARVRFAPSPIDEPSLHLRFISANGNLAAATLVGVDDLTVRRAVEPELGVRLGPVEVR
ncbi:MAG: hypothetical protein IT384_27030 [Deltaproteobacteria bacterium]|nr:hypothetical protein [Deltaproteobacteria bacterium]